MIRYLSGRAVFLSFVAFFGVIMAVNVLFIVKAVATFSGEDEDDSYTQGLAYNHTLERHAIQQRLGWTATIDAQRESSRKARVVVVIDNSNGAPLGHLSLMGTLRRPTDAGRDRILNFVEVAPGSYAAEARDVDPGIWDVDVETASNAPFDASRRLWIP